MQIDHTPLDVIVVDEVHRKPIGRPYLTLAIDVYSRMVAGLYVTLDAPSATSVAMCISHAMNTKNEYLRELGVEGDWPVWGRSAHYTRITRGSSNARRWIVVAGPITSSCNGGR